MHHYTAITEDIKIEVRPVYIDGQSDIIARKFVFAYFVKIRNQSKEKIQVLRRHWLINHGGYRSEEVEGEALAKGVRIVQELGLDKIYGYKIEPRLARAA